MIPETHLSDRAAVHVVTAGRPAARAAAFSSSFLEMIPLTAVVLVSLLHRP
jgi:hypothetical protein